MVNTTVRAIPDDWYEGIKLIARLERRSINAQIVDLIGHGLDSYQERGEYAKEAGELAAALNPTPPCYCASCIFYKEAENVMSNADKVSPLEWVQTTFPDRTAAWHEAYVRRLAHYVDHSGDMFGAPELPTT